MNGDALVRSAFLAALERRQALRHARRIDRTVARHDPRGASTETTSPTPLPIKAARGASRRTRRRPRTRSSPPSRRPGRPRSRRSSRDRRDRPCRGRQRRLTDPRPQLRDPRLEQPLFVLRSVVLEVLGQIAECAGRRDGLDRGSPARPFELRELGPHRLHLLGVRTSPTPVIALRLPPALVRDVRRSVSLLAAELAPLLPVDLGKPRVAGRRGGDVCELEPVGDAEARRRRPARRRPRTRRRRPRSPPREPRARSARPGRRSRRDPSLRFG